MERNIKIVLEYEGTAYHGWQYQENLVTVQGKLEEAIHKLTGETVRVTAAGRTDSGVHARGQVVNFRINSNLPIHKIEMGLNAHLPRDISVKSAEVAEADFNARFSAKQRIYHYYISTERTALMRNFCWQFFQKFDTGVLNPLAELLIGQHDFGAFSRMEVQSDHKICIVFESRWFAEKHLWIYRIAANRFLHGMVRTIVGTMIDVARGRFSEAQFRGILESRDRLAAGSAAPAKGLVLEEVVY
jgi:tRNA pseudouridine38-40 synthase